MLIPGFSQKNCRLGVSFFSKSWLVKKHSFSFRFPGPQESESSDDESVFRDDASFLSEGSFFRDDGGAGALAAGGGDSDGEQAAAEIFEEKLKEAMDLATQKSANGRVSALKNLCRGLLRRIVPDFVEDRRATLTDLIEKALKRGKEDEQRAASILAALVCVQLGLSDAAEEFYQEVKPVLTTQMSVPTAPQRARAAMATTLGLLAFLQCPPEETEDIMAALEAVFRSHAAGPELQTEALSSWALLATFLPSYRSVEALRGGISAYLLSALDSSDVDLRIAAGEAVAVLYERADDEAALKEDFRDKIRDLSTDSNKYRSKKDRKEQRSSFREVLKTIEGEESPVHLAKMIRTNEMMEKLVIDSWRAKKQYDLMRKARNFSSNISRLLPVISHS